MNKLHIISTVFLTCGGIGIVYLIKKKLDKKKTIPVEQFDPINEPDEPVEPDYDLDEPDPLEGYAVMKDKRIVTGVPHPETPGAITKDSPVLPASEVAHFCNNLPGCVGFQYYKNGMHRYFSEIKTVIDNANITVYNKFVASK